MTLLPLFHRGVPAPSEAPWTLDGLGLPQVGLVVFGTPAPQGSKNGRAIKKDGEYTGKVAMHESSKKVKPWRDAVATIALHSVVPKGMRREDVPLLIGPIVADMVFTLRRPKVFPKNKPWDLRWLHKRPTTTPDLSKLARSTEDALTGVVWHDDSHVVAYRRLEKVYVGSTDPDALDQPGAVIRVWARPTPLQAVGA